MLRRLWLHALCAPPIWKERLRIISQSFRRPRRVAIGASDIADAGWIKTEAAYLNLLRPRDWARCFRKGSVDAFLAEHVWEHLTAEEGLAAARLCREYLRPGGYLRIAVPDGFHADPGYIEKVRPGGSGEGAGDHKVLYTVETLGAMLARAGLRAEPREWFDAAGRFHTSPWRTEDGTIRRSSRLDPRNRDGKLIYTSLFVDAFRDA